MPVLTHIAIPVVRQPQSDARSKPSPRTYGDEPLPFIASEHAPRQAKILSREADGSMVSYTLKIGETEIHDVGVQEILDFVSAYDLEQFETQQFREEIELEEREIARLRRLEEERFLHRKPRAKRHAFAEPQLVQDSSDDNKPPKVPVGKHGRARPSYAHMYKPFKERRRRRRDPVTGELMPLSDDELMSESHVSGPDHIQHRLPIRRPAPSAELPKRRRRKRDKITGELLPLSPIDDEPRASVEIITKRRRRRRHPLTGKLMPLGWRYNPEVEEEVASEHESSRIDRDISDIQSLSITHEREHDVKRMKLSSQSPSDESHGGVAEADETVTASVLLRKPPNPHGEDRKNPVSSGALEESRSPPNPSPKSITLASFFTSMSARRSTSVSESSSDDLHGGHQHRAAVSSGMRTSILHPHATKLSSQDEGEDEGEDVLEDDEWFVEDILAHHLSDPKTHPPQLGKKPVMLYQVKWEGYAEPTWEPYESFEDPQTIIAYRKRAGLDTADETAPPKRKARYQMMSPQGSQFHQNRDEKSPSQSTPSNSSHGEDHDGKNDDVEDEDEDEDEGFEVETILGHEMSDPRTHPGRVPVMLYHVKWVGFDQPTWEPISSFDDTAILERYKRSVGLNG